MMSFHMSSDIFSVFPVKVACVGDSITFGAFIEDPEENSYPAQLGKLLGPGFEVRNFGVKGACLLDNSTKPYREQDAYHKALAYKPDIVLIMLGTNDSHPDNWRKKSEFKKDYMGLIGDFKKLKSAPAVWVCVPPPALRNTWGIQPEVIKDEIAVMIKHISKAAKVHLIDFQEQPGNSGDFLPDGIHPGKGGANKIAHALYNSLIGNKRKPVKTNSHQ